jgi:polyketide biosynthesis enoyl-CoA hydratase PksH
VTYRTLLRAATAHAQVVTLHRPARHNALDDAMLDELHAALDDAERTPGCRLFVLSGEGGVFCAGMDLEEAASEASAASAANAATARRSRARFFALLRRFTTSPRVVVSLVDGRCEGGGVGLAAASDFVFGSPRARFVLPEALWGLRPISVLPFLERRVGPQLARTMTLGTLSIDARRAERSGLIDELADDPAIPLARLTGRLAKIDPETTAAAKRALAAAAPISEAVEAAVLRELDELFASAKVARTLAAMSGPGRRFPWEN